MSSILLILCALIWLPILVYSIINYGYTVLLIWLLIAPVALNVFGNPGRNPFFSPYTVPEQEYFVPEQSAKRSQDLGGYAGDQPTNIRLKEVLDPTRLLFIGLAFALLLERLYKDKRLVPLDRTEVWMALFGLIVLVNAALLSQRPLNGVRVAIDVFLVPFLAYAFMRRLVSSAERFRQFTWTMIALGLYLIAIALLERLMHPYLLYRLQGPFPQRNLFYIVLMTVFFMALLDLLRSRSLVETRGALYGVVRWVVLWGAPLVIVATWTRSNWLGFLSGSWVLLFLGRRFINRGHKLVAVGLGLLLVPVLLVGFLALAPEEMVEGRIGDENSIYARIGAWQLQLQEGINHPLFGIGFNNVRALLATQRVYVMGVRSETTSHNCFLAFFVELGTVGLLAYLAIALSITRMGLQRYRQGPRQQDQWAGICSIAILVAYLVPALTSTILYVPWVSHVYVFACIGGIAGVNSSVRPATYKAPTRAAFRYPQSAA